MAGLAWITWVGWTLVAIGAAAMVVGVVGRSTRGVRSCPKCGYDLSATPGLMCPECGVTANGERALYGRRRRRAWRRLGLLVLLVSAVVLVLNPNRRDGWAADVPDWVLWKLTARFDADLAGAINAVQSAPPCRWERALRSRQHILAVQRNVAGLPAQVRFGLRYDAPDDTEPQLVVRGLLEIAEQTAGTTLREAAILALRRYAPIDATARDRVRRLMRAGPGSTWLAGFVILQISTVDRTDLRDIVMAGLDHSEGTVRCEAACWLGYQDAGGAFALEKLEALRANDPDGQVRHCAEQAISSIQQGLAGAGPAGGR